MLERPRSTVQVSCMNQRVAVRVAPVVALAGDLVLRGEAADELNPCCSAVPQAQEPAAGALLARLQEPA